MPGGADRVANGLLTKFELGGLFASGRAKLSDNLRLDCLNFTRF